MGSVLNLHTPKSNGVMRCQTTAPVPWGHCDEPVVSPVTCCNVEVLGDSINSR